MLGENRYQCLARALVSQQPLLVVRLVGPICESGDFFCQNRPLPKISAGEYLALMSAGAYGSVMASNYNSRPLPAEVLVNGKRAAAVRERQKLTAIWQDEKIAPWFKSSLSR